MPTLAEQVAALQAERDAWKDAKRKAEDRAVERVRAMRERAEKAERELLAAESRLASARVEGAREGFEQAGEWLFSTYFYAKAASVEWMGMEKFRLEAERRYPAPTAPAGEQTRPAPTPEPIVIPLTRETDHFTGITLTPEDCRRIVALGSRPTQTAEG